MDSLPIALVLSSDQWLLEELEARLARVYVLQSVEELGEALSQAQVLRPAAFIADLRSVRRGGHAEGALLESLAQTAQSPLLAALLAEECPEPLERDVACSGALAIRDSEGFEELAEHLRRKAEAGVPRPAQYVRLSSLTAVEQQASRGEPGQRSAPHVIPNGELDDECEFALSGLTRRFETSAPKLKMMLGDLEVAARHDVTVLLIGETGSGKTYLSRLVHEISPRRDEPFLPLACGALPADLIESELFGHVKGAFTSAHADKEGKFIAAGRGTILLDEIDALGPEQQVKLLRVIESGEFEPVGSNRTLKSAARLIVASNVDLQPLVDQKQFRPDLYYRLNMLKFEIPPLRDRREDVVPLARKFIREQSEKHRVPVERIDPRLFDSLLQYSWPGNVRELEHVIQRAVIYCRDGVLSCGQLPPHVLFCQPGPGPDAAAPHLEHDEPARGGSGGLLSRQVALSERELIEQMLFQTNQSRTHAAKALGISRVTLYNKMKKYGISR